MTTENANTLHTPQPLRILHIENVANDAELCRLELTRAGFTPDTDVVETLEDFRRHVSLKPYDVILADYNLPGWRGTEAIPYLRQERRDVPLILVTGSLGEEAAVEGIKSGAADYVLKGNLVRLPVAVRRALEENAVRRARADAEESVRRLNTELEARVKERTAQLEQANQELEREIRERRWAAESLDRLRRENELILNSAGEGIWRVDADGKCTFANSAAARMLGRDPGELIGRSLHGLVCHSDATGTPYPLEQCPLCKVRERGTLCTRSGDTFCRKDGTTFPVDYISTPLREGSRIVGAVVTFHDMTERRALERM